MLRPVLTCPVILLLLASPVAGQIDVPPQGYAFTPAAGCPGGTPQSNHGYRVCDDQMMVLADALAAARRDGKLLIVEIAASWCPQCHHLKRLMLTDQILKNTSDGLDFAGRFAHVEIVTSTLHGGKTAPVPSGEAVVAVLDGQKEGADMRGWPYLFVLDPAGSGRTLGHNTDTLAAADGLPDPANVRRLLEGAWRALREGAAPPADDGPSLITRLMHKLFGG